MDKVASKPKQVESEIIRQSPATQAVMVSAKQLRVQMERDQQVRQVIDDYIKANMVEGKDYGAIEVKNGVMSKPSLFKPGAEKFCGLFKIRPTFRKDTETVEMFGNKPGIIAYICELVDTRGRVIGEGRGVYSVSPTDTDFNINKAVKIAEKRAQIDAVLRTGALSDFFTQDTEDMPKGASGGSGGNQPATDKQRALIQRKLEQRGVKAEEQRGYLVEMFEVEVPLTKESASFVIEQLINQDDDDQSDRNEMEDARAWVDKDGN